MKILHLLLLTAITYNASACSPRSAEKTQLAKDTSTSTNMKLNVTIGANTFTATLYNNATVTAFKTKLPMTINMKELNANEKYFDLPTNLRANASNPGTIQSGDLMLYGSKTLLLFYKSFSTSYDYTPLGRIDNTSGLTAALGSSNVTVTFELE